MPSQLISQDRASEQPVPPPNTSTDARIASVPPPSRPRSPALAAPRLSQDQARHIAGRLKKSVAIGAFVGFGALSALVGTHLSSAATAQATTSSGNSTSSSSSSQSSADGGFFDQRTGGSSNGNLGSSASSSSPVSGS